MEAGRLAVRYRLSKSTPASSGFREPGKVMNGKTDVNRRPSRRK